MKLSAAMTGITPSTSFAGEVSGRWTALPMAVQRLRLTMT